MFIKTIKFHSNIEISGKCVPIIGTYLYLISYVISYCINTNFMSISREIDEKDKSYNTFGNTSFQIRRTQILVNLYAVY